MNHKLTTYGGGGIFSLFMDLVLPNAFRYESDKYYIEVRENQYSPPKDCFSFVFNQEFDETYKEVKFQRAFKGGFRKEGISWGAIEDFIDLDLVRGFCKKFDIKKEILNRLQDIPPDTLGIHFRGADMDNKHPQYGVFKYDDYKSKIEEINPSSIFIASDNDEVIERIQSDFDIPVYYYTFTRAITIEEDTYDIQMYNAGDPLFWQEAFIDMLTLARCDSLLCRLSGLSNAAIAFSDTIKTIHRL
jgi:hypothetical protein